MILDIYAEKIYYYKNVVKNPYELIDLIEVSDSNLTENDAINPWHEWVTSGDSKKYVFGSQKFTNESKLPTSSEDVRSAYTKIKSALTEAGKSYALSFGMDYVDLTPISISKYTSGASMGRHVDDYGNPKSRPLMSAVLYLNDDYEGGELYFPLQEIKIKPEAGSIIVFPSVEPFFHESLPISKGEKYMAPAFWIKQIIN
jgi:predicted 2-oxoglutarate/Fe(II)-dependent dioxygenase YbiX